MARPLPITLLFAGLFAVATLAGCERPGDRAESDAERTAREAVGVEQDAGGTERTIEQQRNLRVEETKTVIDEDTGQILDEQKTVTPVQIIEEKEVSRDIEVKTGDTSTTTDP